MFTYFIKHRILPLEEIRLCLRGLTSWCENKTDVKLISIYLPDKKKKKRSSVSRLSRRSLETKTIVLFFFSTFGESLILIEILSLVSFSFTVLSLVEIDCYKNVNHNHAKRAP